MAKKQTFAGKNQYKMKQRLLYTLVIVSLGTISVSAQGGSVFGIKGGPALTTQQWQSFDRDPLLRWQGDVFVESLAEENSVALFASLGYHPKGSAIRNQIGQNFFNNSGQLFRIPPQRFIFHNVSLILGAKQKFDMPGRDAKFFYALGVRGDYTVDTNLDEFEEFNNNFVSFALYPIDNTQFIREINYGITVGGGMEYALSEFVGLSLELNFHPDFSLQYEQPEIPNVTNPFTFQPDSIPERRIRNLALEVSLGLRFLRKVIYVD
jgi:hypothetical protein